MLADSNAEHHTEPTLQKVPMVLVWCGRNVSVHSISPPDDTPAQTQSNAKVNTESTHQKVPRVLVWCGSDVSVLHASTHCGRGITVTGSLPKNLDLTKVELINNLVKIGVHRKKPPKELANIEAQYEELRSSLIEKRGGDYDRKRIEDTIQKLHAKIGKEKSRHEQQRLEEKVKSIEEDWLGSLEEHIEDAIFLEAHTTIIAVRMGQSSSYCVRWARQGCFRVMETTKHDLKCFLSDDALWSGRFVQASFAPVRKYDRRETVESTTFAKATKCANNRWMLLDQHGESVTVGDKWARSPLNLPPDLHKECLLRYKTKDNHMCLVDIPPGSSRVLSRATKESCMRNPSSPPIVYLNLPKCHNCMAGALSSSLHFLGFADIAQQIWKRATEDIKIDSRFVQNFVGLLVNPLLRKHKMILQKNGKNNRFDPLATSDADRCLRLAKLKPKCGGLNHVVAFAGGHIFDPNRSFALPITKENLETVCDGTGYCSLYWCYSLLGKGLRNKH